MERRLAAIMATDVVSYSRLIRADEEGTLAALQALRADLIDPRIAEHNGRIVKLMGDGMLVEFASVVDAVHAAVETQQAMIDRNAGVPADKRIELRIGINLGDVVIDGDDIQGDGVNLAARLEGMAEPGGLCVSGMVYEGVRDRIDVPFDDLGNREVKNIDRPVRVWQWVADGSAAVMFRRTDEPLPLPDKPSIAVLPFTNMSGDPEQEYFADGMTEDIITELSRFRELFVIARNSSFSYKGKSVKVQSIGADLGVAYVVEGSVRKAGNRVRVTAQLVETGTGNHAWAERFDRDLEDIFAIQDEITRAIVTALTRRLETAGIDRAMRGNPQNMAAYELYLRGRHLADRFNLKDVEDGLLYLKEATALDPNFARAQAYLAWLTVAQTWWKPDLADQLDDALTIARQAVELDREDSLCHSLLSIVHLFRQEYAQAEACVERAEALNPNDYWEGMVRCHVLCHLGYSEEALAKIRSIERYEPYPPNWLWDTLGIILYDLGRFEEAADVFRRLTSLNWWNHAYIAACFGQLGRQEEAQKHLELFQEMSPENPLEFTTEHKNISNRERWLEGLRKAGLPI